MFYDQTYVEDTRIYCRKDNGEDIDDWDDEKKEQREEEKKVKAEIVALLEKRTKALMKKAMEKAYKMRPSPVNTGKVPGG